MNEIQVNQKPKFSVALKSDVYQNLINSTLREPKRAANFIANISTVVATNPALQECDAATILSAGLVAETLQLSMNQSLGHCYLVPFNDNKNNRKVAQFQLGYKGYLQLAMRSGNYKKINVLPIKEGELISYDPLEEEIKVNISDSFDRENKKTIGYYAMFEYLNGFKKSIYWSFEKMMAHADKYSQAFSAKETTKIIKDKQYKLVSYVDYRDGKYNKKDEWLYSSFWYKSFDDMAMKTMLRQLISKWGIMSIEMQKAYFDDMGVIDEKGNVEYVENKDIINVENEIKEEIEVNANTGEVVEIKEEPKQEVKEQKNIFTDNPY